MWKILLCVCAFGILVGEEEESQIDQLKKEYRVHKLEAARYTGMAKEQHLTDPSQYHKYMQEASRHMREARRAKKQISALEHEEIRQEAGL